MIGHREDLFERDHVVVLPSGQPERPGPVAHPAGVMQQLIYRDGRADVGHLGDVAADVVAEAHLPLAAQHRDRHAGKLLRDRSDVEDRRRRDGDAMLEVGHPVPLGEDHAPVAHDGDREPGRVCPVECGEERVDAHRDRAWQRLGRQGRRDREEYRDGDESGEKTGHVGRHSKAG